MHVHVEADDNIALNKCVWMIYLCRLHVAVHVLNDLNLSSHSLSFHCNIVGDWQVTLQGSLSSGERKLRLRETQRGRLEGKPVQ